MTKTLAAVLSDLPLLRPVLTRAQAKYVAWCEPGELKGTIEVSDDEARQVELLGCGVRKGGRVELRRLDEALRACSIGRGLIAVIEDLNGNPVQTRKGQARERDRGWEKAAEEIRDSFRRTALVADTLSALTAWLERDAPLLRRRHGADPRALQTDVRHVLGALEVIRPDDDAVALAVLAERVAKNSHAFDPGTSTGTLLDRVLAHLHPEVDRPFDRGAEGRDELLAAAGIVRDRTSAKVDVFGIRTTSPHFAYLHARPVDTFSLRMMEHLRGGHLRAYGGVVFVVENPPVFDSMVDVFGDLAADERPTIVCTNGQLNLADRLLLRELVRGGAHVRYAGDFDAAGVGIAATVLTLLGEHAEPWRMSPDDYLKAIDKQSPTLTEDLPNVPSILEPLLASMRSRGYRAHQEALLDGMIEDVRVHLARTKD